MRSFNIGQGDGSTATQYHVGTHMHIIIIIIRDR